MIYVMTIHLDLKYQSMVLEDKSLFKRLCFLELEVRKNIGIV